MQYDLPRLAIAAPAPLASQDWSTEVPLGGGDVNCRASCTCSIEQALQALNSGSCHCGLQTPQQVVPFPSLICDLDTMHNNATCFSNCLYKGSETIC